MKFEMSVDDECVLWNSGIVEDACAWCGCPVLDCRFPCTHATLCRLLFRAPVRLTVRLGNLECLRAFHAGTRCE